MLPPPQGPGVVQTGYQVPAGAPTAVMTPPQLVTMLHDALYPSQREWAAERLAAFDWKQNEAAVQALTQAVREDPAATVRATCLRTLARMKANTYPVVSVVLAAKNDTDTRVRVEADETLAVIAPSAASAPPHNPAPTIQPTGAFLPSPTPPAPAPTGVNLPPLP